MIKVLRRLVLGNSNQIGLVKRFIGILSLHPRIGEAQPRLQFQD